MVERSGNYPDKSFLRKLGEGSLKKKLAGVLLAGAIETATACQPDMNGVCENPNMAEMSLERSFDFEDDVELSSEQKELVKKIITTELDKIEPAFRQNLDAIEIVSSDKPNAYTGQYQHLGIPSIISFENKIRIDAPKKRTDGAINIENYMDLVRGIIAHEIGHHVDYHGGIKDDYINAKSTLYKEYGPGTPDFNGQNVKHEDAAEGFRLYRNNKFNFLLYYFQQDPANIEKFRSLRDGTFCGKDYLVENPLNAYEELKALYKKDGVTPDEIYEKIKNAYDSLDAEFRDDRLEVFMEFIGFYNQTKSAKTRLNLEYLPQLEKKYEALRAKAEAAQWESMITEIDFQYAIDIIEQTRSNFARQSIESQLGVKKALEFLEKAFSGGMPTYREYSARNQSASMLIGLVTQPDVIEKILEPNLRLSGTTTAQEAKKTLHYLINIASPKL